MLRTKVYPVLRRLSLLSGSVRTGDMVADNPGQWFLHCHVSPCPS